MTDVLFPALADMETLGGFVATFVAWGIGLSVVFYIIGYMVWFVIQLMR